MRKIKTSPDAAYTAARVDSITRRLGELKEIKDSAEDSFKDVKTEAIQLFDDAGVDKRRLPYDDAREVQATVKEGRTNIDEEKLKKAIGAPAFNKLTTAKIDYSKVEDAVAKGDLDPNILASCISQGDSYMDVRFYARKKK